MRCSLVSTRSISRSLSQRDLSCVSCEARQKRPEWRSWTAEHDQEFWNKNRKKIQEALAILDSRRTGLASSSDGQSRCRLHLATAFSGAGWWRGAQSSSRSSCPFGGAGQRYHPHRGLIDDPWTFSGVFSARPSNRMACAVDLVVLDSCVCSGLGCVPPAVSLRPNQSVSTNPYQDSVAKSRSCSQLWIFHCPLWESLKALDVALKLFWGLYFLK